MIEFGVAAVVPEMCAVLSELGADVIKIESRANLDVLRMGSGKIELIDKNFTFNDECRGRRSVALDLNTERVASSRSHCACRPMWSPRTSAVARSTAVASGTTASRARTHV